jgi:hypothetical protein
LYFKDDLLFEDFWRILLTLNFHNIQNRFSNLTSSRPKNNPGNSHDNIKSLVFTLAPLKKAFCHASIPPLYECHNTHRIPHASRRLQLETPMPPKSAQIRRSIFLTSFTPSCASTRRSKSTHTIFCHV